MSGIYDDGAMCGAARMQPVEDVVTTALSPAAHFPTERWAALSNTVRNPITDEHPGLDDPVFGCHKGAPGDNSDLACAGWLARFGGDHVRVRLAVVKGWLPEHMTKPGENWPPLHETWGDVVRHQSIRVSPQRSDDRK